MVGSFGLFCSVLDLKVFFPCMLFHHQSSCSVYDPIMIVREDNPDNMNMFIFWFLKVFQLVLQCERECCMFCQKEINSWHYHCNNFCNNLDMILKGIQLSPVHQLGKTDFCTCMHVLLLKLVSISCI